MAAPPTITQIKEHFVANQILHLGASSLSPSPTFHAGNDASDQPLDARHVQSVVAAVNSAVQAHCRRIFVPQANRAVAEQISDAYTKDAERRLRHEGGDDEEGHGEDGIGKELDLADSKAIKSLPPTWPSDKDVTAHPMEAKRYADSVQSLMALQSAREDLKVRVERLRRLQSMVEPLQIPSNDDKGNEDGGSSGRVQENLVTRGGAIEKELERMRMLLVRVAGRVGSLPTPPAARRETDEAESMSAQRKRDLDSFLSDPSVFPNT